MKIPFCVQTVGNCLMSIQTAKVYIISEKVTKVHTNIFILYEM